MSAIKYDERPIGVFDSGIGGLTILKALMKAFPQENFVYLGDTARVPYGNKSPETIKKYSAQNMAFLKSKNVKAIVIACNTASSHFLENIFEGLPVYNVVSPGAWWALQKTENKNIGILGTRATIESQSYNKALHQLDENVQAFGQACPLFVPLAEEGWDDDPITNLIVYRYVSPLLKHDIDTVILGCTHYPILANSIRKVVGSQVQLVESGEAVAEWMKKDFEAQRVLKNSQLSQNPDFTQPLITIFATDMNHNFKVMTQKILSTSEGLFFQQADL